jgi:hypothetical protein
MTKSKFHIGGRNKAIEWNEVISLSDQPWQSTGLMISTQMLCLIIIHSSWSRNHVFHHLFSDNIINSKSAAQWWKIIEMQEKKAQNLPHVKIRCQNLNFTLVVKIRHLKGMKLLYLATYFTKCKWSAIVKGWLNEMIEIYPEIMIVLRTMYIPTIDTLISYQTLMILH